MIDWKKEKERIEALPYTIPSKLAEILDAFKEAIYNKNTSVVILIDGRSGMGKTTLGNQIGRYCDPNFDLHKLHYEPTTFLQGGDGKVSLTNATMGDYIMFDEAMLISSRSALSQINKMIIQAMSMIRSKNIIVTFCVNSIFDLDRNLTLSRGDILLHVYGESLVKRGQFCAFFKGSDGMDRLKDLYLQGKKYYSYNRPRANFFTRFSSKFVLDEVEYEKQKQIGVNRFLQGIEPAQTKQKLVQARLFKHLKNNLGLSAEKIAEIAGVHRATVYDSLGKMV